jgi:hypothetical protein
MPSCLGEQTHSHAEEERENHNDDDLQWTMPRNGVQDRRGTNQKPNSRKSEHKPHDHINAVFANKVYVWIIAFANLFLGS